MAHYIELSSNFIRFDPVNLVRSVIFDESNKQIFAVSLGGATTIVVKGPVEDTGFTFYMSDRGGAIRWVKFSPDKQVLAVQRKENAVEFVCFQDELPLLQDIITHQVESLMYGFVWVHDRVLALISNRGVETFQVFPETREVRSVKALSIRIKWYAWWCDANVALLCTTRGHHLVPVLVNQKDITKLPKVDLGSPGREVLESKVTLGRVYGVLAVFILEYNSTTSMMEVEVHLLKEPELEPKKCHVLRLSLLGRLAINTVDNLIVVHHQATQTSLLFDIALSGEVINDVTYHAPLAPGRSIKPFELKEPSLSPDGPDGSDGSDGPDGPDGPDGQILQCELYSTNWVIFQPNIVIDTKLGCIWYLNLAIEPLCNLISDRIRLTEFLLQRCSGKEMFLKLMKELLNDQYRFTILPVVEPIFDKINKIYASWVQLESQSQTAQPSNVTTIVKPTAPPIVLIEQSDFLKLVQPHLGLPNVEPVLILYLGSLHKYNIRPQKKLSKIIIGELIENRSYDTLRRLVSNSMLLESKPIATFLVEQSDVNSAVYDAAIDMLGKIQAYQIMVDFLLKQGNVTKAMEFAKSLLDSDKMPRRDNLICHKIFKFFRMRSLRKQAN